MGPGRNESHEWSQGVVAVWSSCGPELDSTWGWVLQEAEAYMALPFIGAGLWGGYCAYDSVGDLYIQD